MSVPRLRDNIFALGAVQAANLLVPLVTLPYLTRVLGPAEFGRLVFVQVVMSFFVLFVDFGFSLSATKAVSENRYNPGKVSDIFSATWTAQWLLLASGAIVLGGLVTVISSLRSHAQLHFWGFGLVVASVLFPAWLLQGLENMKVVATIQLFGKMASVPLLFTMVKGPDDQVMAMAAISLGSLGAGVISIVWIFRNRLVIWRAATYSEVCKVLREGVVLFFSRVSISLYTTLIPLVVGVLAGPAQLGYFNLAEKVRALLQAIIAPISQALFPRMSLLFKTNAPAAIGLLKLSSFAVLGVAGVAGALVFSQAGLIAYLLGGPEFSEAAEVLRWMAFVPLVVAVSNTLGLQVMLPLGLNKSFALILSLASLVSLVLVYPMVKASQGLGAAQLVFLVESVVTLAMAIYLFIYFSRKDTRNG